MTKLHDLNKPSMANTVMVSRVTSHVSKNFPIAPRNKRSFERSSKELPSIDSVKFSKTSVLEHLKENLQTEGVSKRASDLITNSRCTGSLKYIVNRLWENGLDGVVGVKCALPDVILVMF